MAGEQNPTGAGGPPSGGGGGKPPLDPGVADVFQKMEEFIGAANMRLTKTEEAVRKVTGAMENLNDEFRKNVKASEDIEALIMKWGKKRRDLNAKEFQDAKKTREEL